MHRLSLFFYQDQLWIPRASVEGGSGRHEGGGKRMRGPPGHSRYPGDKGSRRQSPGRAGHRLGIGSTPPGLCGRGWWMECKAMEPAGSSLMNRMTGAGMIVQPMLWYQLLLPAPSQAAGLGAGCCHLWQG